QAARADLPDRAMIVLALLFLAVVAVTAARKWGLVRVDRRVLMAALPGFPLTLAVLVWNNGASASHFLGPHVWELVAVVAAAAVLIHGLGTLLLIRGYASLLDRLTASSGVAAVGLLAASLPLALSWIVLGDAPHLGFIGAGRLFLIPAIRFTFAAYS